MRHRPRRGRAAPWWRYGQLPSERKRVVSRGAKLRFCWRRRGRPIVRKSGLGGRGRGRSLPFEEVRGGHYWGDFDDPERMMLVGASWLGSCAFQIRRGDGINGRGAFHNACDLGGRLARRLGFR